MLGNEHRMSSKRRLLAIVGWFCWGKPLRDKVAGVLEHYRQGLLPKINKFRRTEMKAPSERRLYHGLKDVIDASHALHLGYWRIVVLPRGGRGRPLSCRGSKIIADRKYHSMRRRAQVIVSSAQG